MGVVGVTDGGLGFGAILTTTDDPAEIS